MEHFLWIILLLLTCASCITDGEDRQEKPELTVSPSYPLPSVVSGEQATETGLTVPQKSASPGRVSATEPYIDPATPAHVKAYAGLPAMLRCLVNNLGQRSVSWVRHQDIHVLTVGRFTFTNDDRFEAQHDDGSNEWVLKLRAPTANDSGTYECQVNTKPIIGQLITLEVLEPKAVITTGSELYLDRGSTLRLTCRVMNAPSTSEFLLWYHKEKLANYDRDQVSVTVEADNGSTTSTLLLTDAQPANSGTYTCSPSNAAPASVLVHVLSGEHPAAIQTNTASFGFRCCGISWRSIISVLISGMLWVSCSSIDLLPSWISTQTAS